MLSLGQRIAEMRMKRGWTQTELSKLSKIPQANLSNIEKNKQDITVSTLRRIAHALEVDIRDFFNEKDYLPVSLTRTSVEKMARAVNGAREKLNANEKNLVGLLKSTLPGQSIRSCRTKETQQAWIELKKILPAAQIRALIEKAREHETKTNRSIL